MKDWKNIESEADLAKIIAASESKPQIIFKHSTTCGISNHAEHKLMQGSDELTTKADFNYLDLLRFRPISNLIAEQLQVRHQSPQVIVLKNREVAYSVTHHGIDAKKIEEKL